MTFSKYFRKMPDTHVIYPINLSIRPLDFIRNQNKEQTFNVAQFKHFHFHWVFKVRQFQEDFTFYFLKPAFVMLC